MGPRRSAPPMIDDAPAILKPASGRFVTGEANKVANSLEQHRDENRTKIGI
jgi:hypothetical protein